MLTLADFDEAYNSPIPNVPPPQCVAPACFVGSYAPVTPAGREGPFYVNTYLLRPDRIREVAGPTPVRAADLSSCIKNNNH
jgi:hypothetical protein